MFKLVKSLICELNIKKCKFCKEPIPIEEEQIHIEQNHNFIKNNFLVCKFCELNVDKNEIKEHEKICGAKTKMCEKCGNYIKLKDFEKHKEEGCFDLLIFDTKEKFYIKNKNNYEPFDEKKEEIFKKIENNFKEVRNNILLSIQNNNNQRINNNNNNVYNKKNVNFNNELKRKNYFKRKSKKN